MCKTRSNTATVLTLALAASLSGGAAQAASSPAASLPAWITGVNLSGAEYNSASTRIYFDYTYPTKSEIDYYTKKGLKLFRVPVLSSRILSTSMTTNGGGPDWKALTGFIAQAATAGAWVAIDLHQYGTMPSGLVGRNAAATTEFVAAWSELAKRLKTTPNVVFGLMNEPNQQSASEWLSGVNAAVAAIRKAGATQLILVPGSYWSGAHNWTTTDNAAVMAGVKDPGNNFAYEVHQYLDQYSSETTAAVAKGNGKTSLVAFTNWARSRHVKGFLGEFGFATTADAMAEGSDLVAYMAANRDVWRGWTYWAGGPWWGNYMFSVEPSSAGDKPQISVLTKYK
ncbi:glycoside hydrolase family 5 protein [Lichenifustis flavocetrariae]|uniref:Glycoside hydrolase family 5 protein n=1 Tax=Lichenifustis flavocetrariae TaxID=2949735 RepID=A0AA42CGE4_9HYPH|nr:glycoside hydrolase family 5 protein [Lichenifustis flavocetrariae]MCW6506513.1 glycoside hydrolase family 5 protein [Lichenifustis flavocetrariae]